MDSHDNLHSGMQMDDKPVYNKFGTVLICRLNKKKPMGIASDLLKFTNIMARMFQPWSRTHSDS